jgi:hypothetical protein
MMQRYKVTGLCPVKHGGKLRQIDELISLDEADAAKLPKGVIELVAPVKETDAPPPEAPEKPEKK